MRLGAVVLMAMSPMAVSAGQACLGDDRAEMLACLEQAGADCLSSQGGGAGYRQCLDGLRAETHSALAEAVSTYQDQLFLDPGTRYMQYFVVDQALWEAWRDKTCETRAYLTYQTGTAAGSSMILCRTRANASRWHDLTHVAPEFWQGP